MGTIAKTVVNGKGTAGSYAMVIGGRVPCDIMSKLEHPCLKRVSATEQQ
jgi:hypothetical protein